MAILENSFTCPNGHSFTANAKLRARCPSCGTQVKRSFKTETPPAEPVKDEKKPPVEVKPAARLKSPVLVKQGRPREERKVVRKRKSLADQIREAKDNASMAKTPRKVTKVSEPLVARKKVTGKITPRAGRKPPKTSISKVTEYGGAGHEPYWQKVSAKFMPRIGRR